MIRRVLMSCLAVAAAWASWAPAQVSETERDALVDLYQATNGDQWSDSSGWLGPRGSECQWFGVLCGNAGSVIGVTLGDNNLTGTIPSSVGDLSGLTSLSLDGNALTGEIPAALGTLGNLEWLHLGYNALTGPIPPELASLRNLSYLNLNENALTGVVPAWLGGLAGLRQLYLGGNQLTGAIPSELGSLKGLIALWLNDNQLSGSIPDALSAVAGMRNLNLSNNQLSGTLPKWLTGLFSLQRLYLHGNQLTGGLGEGFCGLDGLIQLWLQRNRLTGEIPACLGDLPVLEDIWVSDNLLTGEIPPELGEVGTLEILVLSRNRLEGTIPPELGKLSNLWWLMLDGNRLTGRIPPEIGGLGSVYWLWLDGNDLGGEVPATLMQLPSLDTRWGLDLRFNGLTIADPELLAFVEAHHFGGAFGGTQTVPPGDLAGAAEGTSSVFLTWQPIPYTGSGGGYRVYTGQGTAAPATLVGETDDKTVSWMTVDGLEPGQSYAFQVRTVTYAHENNANTVLSDPSATVAAATASTGAAGSVQLAFGEAKAAEGESKQLLVRRLGGVGGAVSVHYDVVGRSATAGTDFATAGGTLSWADGDGGPRAVTVDVIDDNTVEEDETLLVSLSDPSGGVQLGSPVEALVTIADNDFEAGRESDASSDGSGAAVAEDPFGNRVVVWSEKSQLEGTRRIVAQRFAVDGTSEGEPIEVSGAASGVDSSPVVAVNEDGSFLVVWLRRAAGGKTSQDGNGLVGHLFSGDGEPMGEEIAIDDGDVGSVDAAARPDGGFVVVWSRHRRGGAKGSALQEGNSVVGHLYDAQGEPEDEETVLDDGSSGDAVRPAVAAGEGGDIVVAWERETPDGDTDVWARSWDRGKSLAAFLVRVNDDTLGDQGAPSVVVDDRGGFVVAWQGPSLPTSDGSREPGTDVFARLFAAQGVAAGGAVRVNDSEQETQTNARLAINAAGDVFAAWQNEDATGRTGAFGRLLRSDTLTWGKRAGLDLQLNDPASEVDVREPDVTLAEDGEVTAVYGQDDVTEGDGGVSGNVVSASLPAGCQANGLTLCLQQERFEVEVEWADFDGNDGLGLAVPLTSDTGYFWFFKQTNIELILKVLDGTPVNGHFWVFYGALSNVQFAITVRDTVTGSWVRYDNPSGNFASYADVQALPAGAAKLGRVVGIPADDLQPETARHYSDLVRRRSGADVAPLAGGSCTSGSTNLCLNDDRFAVEVDWETTDGRSGEGRAEALTTDTGTFWFFRESNIELVVKVLNGVPVNGHYWVFYGALSDVDYTIRVTDTSTGAVKTYHNPQGQLASVGDTAAFEGP